MPMPQHLLEANIPIRHVQKILGHKTLQSTMIYLHVTTQAQTDSHARIANVMQGGVMSVKPYRLSPVAAGIGIVRPVSMINQINGYTNRWKNFCLPIIFS
jgi:hypothetical protein